MTRTSIPVHYSPKRSMLVIMRIVMNRFLCPERVYAYSIQNYYPLQTRTLQCFESSCPLLKKDFSKNYCPCPLLKKQLPQKCSSCLLLKKQIKNKYFSCLLFLTTTIPSSAILKSDDSLDKIILKSCSM